MNNIDIYNVQSLDIALASHLENLKTYESGNKEDNLKEKVEKELKFIGKYIKLCTSNDVLVLELIDKLKYLSNKITKEDVKNDLLSDINNIFNHIIDKSNKKNTKLKENITTFIKLLVDENVATNLTPQLSSIDFSEGYDYAMRGFRTLMESKNNLSFLAYADDKLITNLIKLGSLDLNFKDSKGQTILHYLASKKDIKFTENIIPLLINLGADISAKNEKGETPLHLAAQDSIPAFVQELIKNGADVLAQNKFHLIPQQYASEHNLKYINEAIFHVLGETSKKFSTSIKIEPKVDTKGSIQKYPPKVLAQLPKVTLFEYPKYVGLKVLPFESSTLAVATHPLGLIGNGWEYFNVQAKYEHEIANCQKSLKKINKKISGGKG